MGRMSDLDIVRQEHGLPMDTPLDTLLALDERGELTELIMSGRDTRIALPMPTVALDGEVERGDWAEATYHDRLEDLEI